MLSPPLTAPPTTTYDLHPFQSCHTQPLPHTKIRPLFFHTTTTPSHPPFLHNHYLFTKSPFFYHTTITLLPNHQSITQPPHNHTTQRTHSHPTTFHKLRQNQFFTPQSNHTVPYSHHKPIQSPHTTTTQTPHTTTADNTHNYHTATTHNYHTASGNLSSAIHIISWPVSSKQRSRLPSPARA